MFFRHQILINIRHHLITKDNALDLIPFNRLESVFNYDDQEYLPNDSIVKSLTSA